MTSLTAVPSPADIPTARRNARLHLQARALTAIKQHLEAGGEDVEFMLRLAANALRSGGWSASGTLLDQEMRRYSRGLEAITRHLTVGGTDKAILIGLVVNALTGYSPATVKEAKDLDSREQGRQVAA